MSGLASVRVQARRSGSDGVTEAVGDYRQRQERHGGIESARCGCGRLRCVSGHRYGRGGRPVRR